MSKYKAFRNFAIYTGGLSILGLGTAIPVGIANDSLTIDKLGEFSIGCAVLLVLSAAALYGIHQMEKKAAKKNVAGDQQNLSEAIPPTVDTRFSINS